MKYLTIAILGLSLLSCEKQKSNVTTLTREDTVQLRQLKEVLWPKSYHEHNAALLDSILHDDFEMITNTGEVSSKQEELNWVKSTTARPDSFYYEIKRLDLFENGTAIIAGTGHAFKDSTGYSYESSNVLVKNKGKWKAIASHVSGVRNR